MLALTASNPLDTERIAQRIAALVRAGDLITLVGTSPTFNLLHTYEGGRLPMHHADLYRLERTGEIADLGITELLGAGGVALVEWGDVAGDALGSGLSIHLQTSEEISADARHIDIGWMGMSWETRWEKLRSSLSEWSRA